MFSLKQHARRKIQMVAIGAAATMTASELLANPDLVYWDPGLTKSTAGGGTGTLSPGVFNLYNPALAPASNDVQPAVPDNQYIYADYPGTILNPPGTIHEGSDIQFGNAGGTVTLSNPTYVHAITLTGTNYTIAGLPLTLGSYCQTNGDYGQTVITNVSGTNLITADVRLHGHTMDTSNYPVGIYFGSRVDVQSGVLTANNIIMDSPGPFLAYFDKVGAGKLQMTGTLFTAGTYISTVRVLQGALILQGTTNFAGTGWQAQSGAHDQPAQEALTVATGATLAGNATIETLNTMPSLDAFLQNGHLAPGANTSGDGRYGAVGTFTLSAHSQSFTSAMVRFGATSELDLDIASDTSYDVFNLGQDGFGDVRLNIVVGAKVNINNGVGSLTPGTYHIITVTNLGLGGATTITDAGLTAGTAPSGYLYLFQDVANGIDLVVAAGSAWIAPNSTSSANWSNAAENWSGATQPNSAGANALFDGTGTFSNVNVESAKTLGHIAFSGSVAYILSGNSITIDNTGGTGTHGGISSGSSATQTISSQIIVANTDLDISSTGGGVLNLSGGLDNGTGKTITVTTSGSGTVKLGASINNGPLNLNGLGNVVVTGAITGGGTTTVNGGKLGGSGSLGAVVGGSGAHTFYASATLPGGSNTTLTMSSLTTNANSTLNFNLVSSGVNDQIHVTGNMSGPGVISLNDNNVGQGYYKVLRVDGSYTGTLTASQAGLPAKEAYVIDTHHDVGFVDIHKVLIGDANADNIVDGADFDTWFTHLLSNTFDYGSGDLTGDGLVDGADFDVWFTHLLNTFGGTSGFSGAGGAPVPEPATLSVLGLGVLLLARRRKTA